jgi:hypothetical protein
MGLGEGHSVNSFEKILRFDPDRADDPGMHAAAQQHPGTMAAAPLTTAARPALVLVPRCSDMSAPAPRQFIIQGLTKSGRVFRPSDWAERLAGAMSCFRPGGGAGGIGAAIGYSPYCTPTSVGEVKAVIVNEALREIEPMAWDFVVNFARDNDLQFGEICLLPDQK